MANTERTSTKEFMSNATGKGTWSARSTNHITFYFLNKGFHENGSLKHSVLYTAIY